MSTEHRWGSYWTGSLAGGGSREFEYYTDEFQLLQTVKQRQDVSAREEDDGVVLQVTVKFPLGSHTAKDFADELRKVAELVEEDGR